MTRPQRHFLSFSYGTLGNFEPPYRFAPAWLVYCYFLYLHGDSYFGPWRTDFSGRSRPDAGCLWRRGEHGNCLTTKSLNTMHDQNREHFDMCQACSCDGVGDICTQAGQYLRAGNMRPNKHQVSEVRVRDLLRGSIVFQNDAQVQLAKCTTYFSIITVARDVAQTNRRDCVIIIGLFLHHHRTDSVCTAEPQATTYMITSYTSFSKPTY